VEYISRRTRNIFPKRQRCVWRHLGFLGIHRLWNHQSGIRASPPGSLKWLLKRLRLIIWSRGSKTWSHPRSQKAIDVILVPKKAPVIPSNSHAGGVLSGAPDTKPCVKNATYPHSALSLSYFSHLGGPPVEGKIPNNQGATAGRPKLVPACMASVSFLGLPVEVL
jgi:hypothetical protein